MLNDLGLDIPKMPIGRDLKVREVRGGNFRETFLLWENTINTENTVTLGNIAVLRKKEKGEIKKNATETRKIRYTNLFSYTCYHKHPPLEKLQILKRTLLKCNHKLLKNEIQKSNTVLCKDPLRSI